MNITRSSFDKLIQKSTFKIDGDGYEQNFGHIVTEQFPNCETFWKHFVIPLTERINGYPNELIHQNIRPRRGIDSQLKDIANTHYTAFLNLIYAHQHIQSRTLCWLEDFYVHLGSVCDLAETFMENFFFLLLKCRGDSCHVLQHLSKSEFITLAEEWYTKNYEQLFGHYLAKGKSIPIRIPTRKNVIKEFFHTYLGNDHLRKRYINHSQTIRLFRNTIVHSVQIGNITMNGQTYLPKPAVIQKYTNWEKVFEAYPHDFSKDFATKDDIAYADLVTLESILNDIWTLIINEYVKEFYAPSRQILRNMYDLVLEIT
jgi:hypothetical protein